MRNNKINKIALFSDIHFGKGSEQHNEDCNEFLDWFCQKTLENNCQAVIFCGDWHEQKNAIHGLTLDASYTGAKKLNALDIPVFFQVGNHDFFFRYNRSVYSTNFFESLNNFIIIDKIAEISYLGPQGSLLAPYLFHQEYPELLKYDRPICFLHSEFQGYVITGDSITMDHGPKIDDFNKPHRIYSGHFHKRQHQEDHPNLYYVGNPFGTRFSDANDFDKGMAIYEYKNDELTFINYDGPSFIKTSLSELLVTPTILRPKATVKCLADEEITLEESTQIRQEFMTKYKLRDFILEEPATTDIIKNTDIDLTGLELEDTDTIVKNLLRRISSESKIQPDRLVKIYEGLK